MDEYDYEPELPTAIDPEPPLRCFTVADAIAQGSYRPRPVAKLDSGASQQQLTEQNIPFHTSDRPTRPSMLRLKSESSAFQDLVSPRPTRPLTATEPRHSFASFASGARDRSSSHESTTSSASYTDEFQQASERRRTVRELADSINRKHANKPAKKQANSQNSTKTSKTTPSKQQLAAEMEMVPERPEPTSNESGTESTDFYSDSLSYDDVNASSKPLTLKGVIERRGTVERYREGLRYGTTHTPRSRKLNIHKSLMEESPLACEKKLDPHISPFHGQHQTHHSRTPARGILKNSGMQESPVRIVSKSSVDMSDAMFATVDSGIGSESIQDTMSTSSGASRSSKSFSNPLTSPESEIPPSGSRLYSDHRQRQSGSSARQKSEIPLEIPEAQQKPLRKQLSKSNSLPKDVLPVDAPESPPFSDEEDDQSTSSSNTYRCPSAPAGSLLSDNQSESQALFPVKDDSLVEEVANLHTASHTSPIRR